MTKKKAVKDIISEISEIISKYNAEIFHKSKNNISYFVEYKGRFLYLKRNEFNKISPIARLTYTGDMNNWEFAIYKWSTEKYDPEECFFPGNEFVDGTIEGALKAGMIAYPL